ncbi:MAG: dynamin family protein [Thermodesulfovibrionales bacterium]|nr:dynamin family protein [Thermodesulfovibrionales bacterium]
MSFADKKNKLLQCIDELLSMDYVNKELCQEIRQKLSDNVFNLVVLGQFKRGKTSLINAMLGADILPMAVIPLTSIVTIITYGRDIIIKVYFNNANTKEITKDELYDYITEKGNPKNIKDVREVVVTYPSDYLKDGVRLIDTPGVGSVYQHNTDVAYEYIPKSDAAVFVLSVDQPISKAEIDFLKDVKEYSQKIFFLLNKADYLTESELKEAMDFTKDTLKEVMASDVRIIPLSAKLALKGHLENDIDSLNKSRINEFSQTLNHFFMNEKGNTLIQSVKNNLLRVISHTRFKIDLQIKSLLTPLDELQEKIKVFNQKKEDIMQEKSDFDILLDGEIKRLTRDVLDEDLTNFRREIIEQGKTLVEDLYRQSSSMSVKEMKSTIESAIVDFVRQAFAIWRAKEDDKLAKAFETICKRFVVRINDTVDSLMRFSSELFEIPFETIKTDALWSSRSHFYYRFQEQPGVIEIITSSITLALPKIISSKIVFKNMQEYLVRAVDTQLGRAGNDFEDRIQKSKLDFRWEMLQRIESTIDGIMSAIQKGISKQNSSEAEIMQTKSTLNDLSKRLTEISGKLQGID